MMRLPGGGYLSICSKHDANADGRGFVCVGVRPDKVVYPTLADFCAGRDTILEAALEEIQTDGADEELMRKTITLLLSAALTAPAAAAQQQPMPPAQQPQPTAPQLSQPSPPPHQPENPTELPPIRDFFRVDKEFCTGGQPRLEHLAKLKAEGVRAVINLRLPSEHRAEEEERRAKELGLRYFNIPVVTGEPKDEQATEFLKLTDDPENRPAFIHCASARRVGAFWMIRRVLRDGWAVERAQEEAEKIGMREVPHLVEFARGYIARHGKK